MTIDAHKIGVIVDIKYPASGEVKIEPSPSRCSQRGANGVRCESFHDDEKGCHFVERIDGKIMFRIGPWTPAREAERLRRIAADDPLY